MRSVRAAAFRYCEHGLTRISLQCASAFLRSLPPARASKLVGGFTAAIGPFLRTSRIADANIQAALPHLSANSRKKVIQHVWRNLGQNVGELPHLANLRRTQSGPGWEVVGEENLPAGPAIYFSAHLNNWEMILPIAGQLGVPISGAYRPASNPIAERMIQNLRLRAGHGRVTMFAKGAAGARVAILHLANGGSLGMLVDQKMNEGIPAPFFGRIAMTATAPAQLALRFNLPLVPVYVQRLAPARVRMVIEPSLCVVRTGDRSADILSITTTINRKVEEWVTADPGAWLWLHRRWPKQ